MSTAPSLTQLVATEVRAEMARQRISGVQLAERLGRSQAYLARRLMGDVSFDLSDLEAIAAELDVDVWQFLPAVAA